MTAKTAWRHWRRQVHDILEVGGDAHPAGRVVNAFIILLIILNAVAFAAETVGELETRYAAEFAAFNVFSVIVFTVEYVLKGVERRRYPDAEPAAALAGAAPIRASADDADRPVGVPPLVPALDLSNGSAGTQAVSPVPRAQTRALLASLADLGPRARR